MKNIENNIDSVAHSFDKVVSSTEKVFNPVRQTLFRRFPVFATLLVAFGVSATFFGIERIIGEISWLNERPVLILALGIIALIISGKLYQKLG